MENAKIIIELYNEDSRYGITSENSVNKKAAAGISRLVSEKSELQVKYDRLLKEYELARHECKLRDEHIDNLKEEQEELLKKISVLRGAIEEKEDHLQMVHKKNCYLYEKLDSIRELLDRE